MKFHFENLLIPFLVLTIVIGCTFSNKTAENQKLNTYAIKNVNIIPMTKGNMIVENATVIIKNRKIQAINGNIPDNAKVIDGEGRYLIPGLIDMHVHTSIDYISDEIIPDEGIDYFRNTQHIMTPFIANGVTTILDLNSKIEHFEQRNEIREGKVIGPRMALAKLLNGGEDRGWVSLQNGRQAVRDAKFHGFNFIKVYSNLDSSRYYAIVDEAEKQNMKVIGHIPDAFRGNLENLFVPNFDLVAHSEEYAKLCRDCSMEEARYFAKLAKENDTWLISSLTTMIWIESQARSLESLQNLETLKYVDSGMRNEWLNSNRYNSRTSPDFIAYVNRLNNFHKKLIKAFNEAKVPIVAGTDVGVPGIIAGFSMHDELELLAKYGLTNEQVLVSATRLSAEWLGIDQKVGTVEVGKYADLVLLDANPLEDIKNSKKITGVFVNGVWVDKPEIENMLTGLAQNYSNN